MMGHSTREIRCSRLLNLTMPSVLLASLWDDISMVGNQCDCYLAVDAIGTNALVVGGSVRVADNRFKEGGIALFSATTLGWFNSTVNNQGTNCFIASGHPDLSDLQVNYDPKTNKPTSYWPSDTNKVFISTLPRRNCNSANESSDTQTQRFLKKN